MSNDLIILILLCIVVVSDFGLLPAHLWWRWKNRERLNQKAKAEESLSRSIDQVEKFLQNRDAKR